MADKILYTSVFNAADREHISEMTLKIVLLWRCNLFVTFFINVFEFKHGLPDLNINYRFIKRLFLIIFGTNCYVGPTKKWWKIQIFEDDFAANINLEIYGIYLLPLSMSLNYALTFHQCTTSFNKAWIQVLRRFKSCSRRVGDSRWWGSSTMVPGANKASRLSSVNQFSIDWLWSDVFCFCFKYYESNLNYGY